MTRISFVTKKRLLIAGGILAIPLLALAWWLGSPLFLDREVNEEFPLSADAEIPADMAAEEVEAEMEKAADQPDAEVTDDMPAETAPVVVSSGDFQGFDDFHEGSGNATVYRLEDGSHVLRLEEFEVTNGPDLHVLLVPDSDPAATGLMEGYVDLGSLKGNIGDQNYEIPAEVDPSLFGSVMIYCQPFHVIFSTASLS